MESVRNRNPFSKSLSLKKKGSSTSSNRVRFKAHTGLTETSCVPDGNSTISTKRKAFDFAIRKRKLCTSPPKYEIKKSSSGVETGCGSCAKHPTSESTTNSRCQEEDFSFGEDVSLSELLNGSHEVSFRSPSVKSPPPKRLSQPRLKICSPAKPTSTDSITDNRCQEEDFSFGKDISLSELLNCSYSEVSFQSPPVKNPSPKRLSQSRLKIGSLAKPPTTDCITKNRFQEEDFSFGKDISLSELLNGSSEVSFQSPSVNDLNQYLVLEVANQSSIEVSDSRRCKPECRLRLYNEKSNTENVCYLRDDWSNANVTPGDIVQVNASYDITKGCYVVDNAAEDSSIIVHPDTLVSGTSVANSVTCARRSVLAERFKTSSGENKAMVVGQMIHTVFQGTLVRCRGMGKGGFQHKVLEEIIREEVKKTVASLETLDRL